MAAQSSSKPARSRARPTAPLATYGETGCCVRRRREEMCPGTISSPLNAEKGSCRQDPGVFAKVVRTRTRCCVAPGRPADPPLFCQGFRNETQVITTVLSYDLENDPDIVAMIGASAADPSGLPSWVPRRRGSATSTAKYAQSAIDELSTSKLDLIVAGTVEGVLMSNGSQRATEDTAGRGSCSATSTFQPVIQAIIELAEACAREPIALPEGPPARTLSSA